MGLTFTDQIGFPFRSNKCSRATMRCFFILYFLKGDKYGYIEAKNEKIYEGHSYHVSVDLSSNV